MMMDSRLTFLAAVTLLCLSRGSCGSTSRHDIPSVDKMRLTNGIVVTDDDYGQQGSASIAVGVGAFDITCIGVMTNLTQFVTSCVNQGGRVFVGSRFYPNATLPDNYYNGQVLHGPGLVTPHPPTSYFSFQVSAIPPGSLAKPALVYPLGTPPPPVGANCLAYGFSRPSGQSILNSIKAVITSMATCNATYNYPTFRGDGTQFCAILMDANGSEAYCITHEDYQPVVLCAPWATKRSHLGSTVPMGGGRLARFCLWNGDSPLCAWLCAWSPYCGPSAEEETVADWYLAGVFYTSASSCGPPVRPTLFEFVRGI